jgi:hypothetical protein
MLNQLTAFCTSDLDGRSLYLCTCKSAFHVGFVLNFNWLARKFSFDANVTYDGYDGCRVSNVMIEYSPGVYERASRWHDYAVWPSMLLECARDLDFTQPHAYVQRLWEKWGSWEGQGEEEWRDSGENLWEEARTQVHVPRDNPRHRRAHSTHMWDTPTQSFTSTHPSSTHTQEIPHCCLPSHPPH